MPMGPVRFLVDIRRSRTPLSTCTIIMAFLPFCRMDSANASGSESLVVMIVNFGCGPTPM